MEHFGRVFFDLFVFDLSIFDLVSLGVVLFGGGGVGVTIFVVVVDGGEGAEEKAVDVGEDGGAARGDAVSGQQAIDIG